MKRFAILLIVLLVPFGVFASGSPEPEDEAIELNFFQFKPYLDEAYADLGAEFTAENPNVTVAVETVGGGAQWQTILRGKFQADEGPDIFPVEGAGQYLEWQDFISDLSGEPFNETALPFALAGMNFDGSQYGMPVNLEGYGYIYNKDIFAEAGITELPETLTELRAAAEAIEAAGYTPFATGYATWWVMSLHMLNVAFAHQDDPQAFIDGMNAGTASMAENVLFQNLGDLVDLTLEFGEENPLTTDHNQQVQMLANGEVAMIQQGVWKEIPIMEANPDINIGLLPMPLNDSASAARIPVGVPFYFVVNSDASDAVQAAARDFLDFMANSETGRQYATQTFGFIPAYSGVSAEGLGGIGTDILDFASRDRTVPWLFGQFPAGFSDDATREIQAYIAGQQGWDEVLTALDDAWARRAQ